MGKIIKIKQKNIDHILFQTQRVFKFLDIIIKIDKVLKILMN